MSTALAVLVIVVALPVHWYATWRMWRLYRTEPDVWAFRERLFVSLALACVVTVFGFIFVHNELEPAILDIEATRVITRTAMLALVLPAAYWLYLFRDKST